MVVEEEESGVDNKLQKSVVAVVEEEEESGVDDKLQKRVVAVVVVEEESGVDDKMEKKEEMTSTTNCKRRWWW